MKSDLLTEKNPSLEEVRAMLQQGETTVEYENWQKVDQFEREQGKNNNRIREKVLSKSEMISIAKSD
jgi:hypothetical protein